MGEVMDEIDGDPFAFIEELADYFSYEELMILGMVCEVGVTDFMAFIMGIIRLEDFVDPVERFLFGYINFLNPQPPVQNEVAPPPGMFRIFVTKNQNYQVPNRNVPPDDPNDPYKFIE